MICPECNGKGETIYYVETDRDENTVTVEQRKGICCTCNGSGEKPQTNADRIRAMSDEELAEFLGQYRFSDICDEGCDHCTYHGDCNKRLLDWLQQPVKENDNG